MVHWKILEASIVMFCWGGIPGVKNLSSCEVYIFCMSFNRSTGLEVDFRGHYQGYDERL